MLMIKIELATRNSQHANTLHGVHSESLRTRGIRLHRSHAPCQLNWPRGVSGRLAEAPSVDWPRQANSSDKHAPTLVSPSCNILMLQHLAFQTHVADARDAIYDYSKGEGRPFAFDKTRRGSCRRTIVRQGACFARPASHRRATRSRCCILQQYFLAARG